MQHQWSPIEDLRSEDIALGSPELEALRAVWSDQRDALEADDLLATFNERLARSWAIETGIIERLYTLDRGTTQLLIEHGLDAALIRHDSTDTNPDRLAAVLEDHRSALEGLFMFVKGGRPLSVSYIKELHASLTRNQETATAVDATGRAVDVPLERGKFKTHPNSPTTKSGGVHEYCPPEQVDSEMDRLVDLFLEHESRDVSPEVEAAWLHHRFTQIHPFQDGNGRVARALASLVTIRAGLFPVVVGRDRGDEYIDALEAADRGDLKLLIDFIVDDQKTSLVTALGLVRETTEAKDVAAVIEAARRELATRSAAEQAEYEPVKSIANELMALAEQRFQQASTQIEESTASVGSIFTRADSARFGTDHDHYFRYQTVQAAKQLDYFADLSEYRAWSRLVIGSEPQSNVMLAIHGVGHRFSGILHAHVSFFRRSRTIEGNIETDEVIPVVDEPFQFNYRESPAVVVQRFSVWLERALVRGLSHWQRSI